jgi:hypothetical protein
MPNEPRRLIDSLTDIEQASFDRAMATVDRMSDGDRRALVNHAVAATIRYATQRDEATLRNWCRGLLRTLRVHADPDYQRARARRGI